MILAKIENNIITQIVDTDKPELFPDYVSVPNNIYAGADVRFYHSDWTAKTEQELIDEGLIVPEEPEVEEPEPEPTFEELKERKLNEINNACLNAIDGGFEYDNNTYDSDQRSQTNIIGTANAVQAGLELPEGFTWRTKDNVNIPFDGEGIIALGAALLEHVNTQYTKSWQLKAQVEAATSKEELEGITW